MIKKISFLVCLLALSTCFVAAQDTACQSIVQDALDLSDNYCTSTGRNQACYAHFSVDAQPQPDAGPFVFKRAGDIVDAAAISSLQVTPYNPAEESWGVAFMRLQANLPDALPGQNVAIVVFGDTEVQNVANSTAQQDPPRVGVTIIGPSEVLRMLPTFDARVIARVQRGAPLIATGRSPDDVWLQVRVPDFGRDWLGVCRSGANKHR